MNDIGIATLFTIAGLALLIYGITERSKRNRAKENNWEMRRRELRYQDDTENSWYRP